MIRVWIVAPSPLARAGLANLLAAQRISVAGASATLDLLAEQILGEEPDAVLVDGSGESADSLPDALIASDLPAETPVIMLLDHPRADWAAEAMRAGVRAILPPDLSSEQLAAAVQAAIAGLFILHPTGLAAALPAASATSSVLAELPEPLTPREREVLQRLAGGLANKQIADQLRISEHTVKFHVASILGKLGAATRTEAVSLGIRHGLVLL